MDWSAVTRLVCSHGEITELKRNGVSFWSKPTEYEALESVYFDGTGMLEMPFDITGADTLRIGFTIGGTQGNLCGWYSGSAGDSNQYSVYTSATSAYVRYDGTLKRGWRVSKSTRFDLVMTPTGYSDGQGYSDTWTAETFTSGHPMLGGLPNSSSAKAKFTLFYFKVDGKCDLRPVKRISDGVVGLRDELSGTFYTGSFIKETAPVSLSMWNPNSGEDDGE